MLFKLKTKLRRFLNSKLKFEHFSSAPYISGDTFRSISNHAFDEFSKIRTQDVSTGDIIFVKNNFLDEFFTKVHPDIKESYILLSHNDDTTIDETYVKYADSTNIIHWFGQNMNVKHPKMTPFPIGIENVVFRKRGVIKNIINAIEVNQNASHEKSKILVAFGTQDAHEDRKDAYKILSQNQLADILPFNTSLDTWSQTLSKYKCIASPRGAGLDCHRTWESIYNGVVPILKKSENATFFKSIGLPIVIVDEWSDLEKWTTESIDVLYEDLRKNMNHPALFLGYWLQKIQEKRLSAISKYSI